MRYPTATALIAAVLALAAAGCEDEPSAPPSPAPASAHEQQAQRLEEAQQARREAQRQVADEQQRRLEAELQARTAQSSRWTWAIGCSLLALVAGVAIASRVRKDYAAQQATPPPRDRPPGGRP